MKNVMCDNNNIYTVQIVNHQYFEIYFLSSLNIFSNTVSEMSLAYNRLSKIHNHINWVIQRLQVLLKRHSQ